MPPSVGEIFTGAYENASKSINDVFKTGAPAVIAAIEQYGAQQLQGLANGNIATAQANVNQIVNAPSSPGGLGNVLGNVMSSIGQDTFFKNYGTQVLVGIAALIVVGYILK